MFSAHSTKHLPSLLASPNRTENPVAEGLAFEPGLSAVVTHPEVCSVRYRNKRMFVGYDGLHKLGAKFTRKPGDPINAWLRRGLIEEVTDPKPTETPKVGPISTVDSRPEDTRQMGPEEVKEQSEGDRDKGGEDRAKGVHVSYKCGDCDEAFCSRAELEEHMADHKPKQKKRRK